MAYSWNNPGDSASTANTPAGYKRAEVNNKLTGPKSHAQKMRARNMRLQEHRWQADAQRLQHQQNALKNYTDRWVQGRDEYQSAYDKSRAMLEKGQSQSWDQWGHLRNRGMEHYDTGINQLNPLVKYGEWGRENERSMLSDVNRGDAYRQGEGNALGRAYFGDLRDGDIEAMGRGTQGYASGNYDAWKAGRQQAAIQRSKGIGGVVADAGVGKATMDVERENQLTAHQMANQDLDRYSRIRQGGDLARTQQASWLLDKANYDKSVTGSQISDYNKYMNSLVGARSAHGATMADMLGHLGSQEQAANNLHGQQSWDSAANYETRQYQNNAWDRDKGYEWDQLMMQKKMQEDAARMQMWTQLGSAAIGAFNPLGKKA